MRGLALAASLALVVVYWDERGAWFWVGVALVVLTVGGFLAGRDRADEADRPTASRVSGGLPLDAEGDGRSHRLDELLSLPGVTAAFAAGPPLWRQVSHLDDTRFEPTTAQELAAYIWLEHDEGWAIGLGDEVQPYLDLDIDEEDDPVVAVLRNHPAVEDAFHADREVYMVEQRRPLSTEEFAELAARALVAHHVHAAARI
jgi:hypothetical protein